MSTGFALQDLLVWSSPVDRQEFKLTNHHWARADAVPSPKPFASLPSSAGACLNPFILSVICSGFCKQTNIVFSQNH